MAMRRLELIDEAHRTAVPAAAVPRLRVALVTADGRSLDAHFGSARRFLIYDVTPSDARLAAMVTFDDTSDESGAHDAEVDRIGPKVAALAGCNLLFVLAIGGPAAAKVVSAGIHPIKLAEPEPIESVLTKVRTMMTTRPPPWLRKAMASCAPNTPRFLDEEE